MYFYLVNSQFIGLRVCRAERPVMGEERILVVDALGPVGFIWGQGLHTTLASISNKTGGQMWSHLINRLLRQPCSLSPLG